jgi:hypothetical protein
MTSKTLKFFASALLLSSVGVVLENAAAATDTTLAEIAPYRQWTRVTEKPMPVANSVFAGD